MSLTDRERVIRRRLRDDFPHFAATCLCIRTKGGAVEPFVLNEAQRYLHGRLEEQKATTGKVRALVLKGRQQGISFGAAARAIAGARTAVPWRAVLVTAAAMLVLAGVGASLAGAYHVFGTDKVGQDVLYQALKSVRTGLVIGTLTTLIMLPFALLFGIMAGYFRGWVDDAVQYLYTTLSSIPGVLLIAAAVLMMQVMIDTRAENLSTDLRADLRLLALCAILGVTSWTGLCRLLRGEALKLREMEYIQAAQAFGVSHWGIMARHLLPWTGGALIVIVPTGLLMFIAHASDFLVNRAFQLKLMLILAGGINAALFHAGVYRGVKLWDAEVAPPLPARLHAGMSLALWFGVIACGRLLAYL